MTNTETFSHWNSNMILDRLFSQPPDPCLACRPDKKFSSFGSFLVRSFARFVVVRYNKNTIAERTNQMEDFCKCNVAYLLLYFSLCISCTVLYSVCIIQEGLTASCCCGMRCTANTATRHNGWTAGVSASSTEDKTVVRYGFRKPQNQQQQPHHEFAEV